MTATRAMSLLPCTKKSRGSRTSGRSRSRTASSLSRARTTCFRSARESSSGRREAGHGSGVRCALRAVPPKEAVWSCDHRNNASNSTDGESSTNRQSSTSATSGRSGVVFPELHPTFLPPDGGHLLKLRSHGYSCLLSRAFRFPFRAFGRVVTGVSLLPL